MTGFDNIVPSRQGRQIASLNRPGGNLTGGTFFGQRLELYAERAWQPSLAYSTRPTMPNFAATNRGPARGGPYLGLQLHILNAGTDRDFDTVFATYCS